MSARGQARRRTATASSVVLVLVAALFAWFAVRAEGQIDRKADLHDGGVWVSNSAASQFGRLNKPAEQLDAGVSTSVEAGSGLDVLQDGGSVIGITKAAGQATPIDVATATLGKDAAVALPAAASATGLGYVQQLPVDLRGGSAAVVEPKTGRLWVQRVGEQGVSGLDQLQPQAKPVATVGATAVVAVGADGTVYAASAATGTVVTVAVDPTSGQFGDPVGAQLGFTSKAVELSAVGSRWVAFDPVTGRLWARDLAKPVQVAAPQGGTLVQAALQQPGPDDRTALVETDGGLQEVDLSGEGGSSTVVTLPDTATGAAGGNPGSLLLARPVRLGACRHATWATATAVWYGRDCVVADPGSASEAEPPVAVQLGTLESSSSVTSGAAAGSEKPVRADGVALRVNRGLIVLNDLDSGAVWDVQNSPVKVDNWESVIPPPQTQDKNTKQDPNLVDDAVARTPPKAQPDDLEVRPGRTSTLHVLDNDSDAQGSILGIAPGDVSQPDVDDVTATVSADGQTIAVDVPDDPTFSVFHFSYKVNNGTGSTGGSAGSTSTATAQVTVHLVDDSVDTAPTLRQGSAGLARASYSVVRAGHLTIGVVADWRDKENDPLTVETTDSGVGVDPSGALSLTAPGQAGKVTVKYAVADGRGMRTAGQVPVTVLGDDDRPVAPLTQPDVVRAVVGKPVQLQPLGNDVPGADPTDPDAVMRLGAAVRGPGQLTLDTDLGTGVVTVTGSAAGTFLLSYGARVGSATGAGRIRVDILRPPSGDPPPVAAPDSAVLREQSPVVLDALANDYSPRSDVVVLQKVTAPVDWVRASVVQSRYLRIEATSALGGQTSRRAVLTYTISDGTASAVGQVSVEQRSGLPAPVPDVEDDEATVRTDDVVTIPVLDNDTVSGGIPLDLDPSSVTVVQGGGQAFASGSVVRYIPPVTAAADGGDGSAQASSDHVVTLEYAAYPDGSPETAVTGRVTVTVTPLPTATTPDQPPVARSFSASVTAGDTTVITVPTSGIDPDGDLGFVGGVVGEKGGSVDLQLGRVTAYGASTITYEAYPRSAGTEVIHYVLRDRFGLSSDAFVRVGVVQPGDPQPPVAVEDDVVAAPGRTVTVDPLENDLIAPGDAVDYDGGFATRNDDATLTAFARQPDKTVKVTAPDESHPQTLTYAITDGLFAPSVSTVTVRGQKGFDNPPVAVDDTATPKVGDTTTTVDVLANDRDLDGDVASLRVKSALGEGVSIVTAGGRQQVRITLTDHPRAVPYVIADADGKTAMAVVYVPTGRSGAPYVISGKTVRMDANGTVGVTLADYVGDPQGKRLTVTSPATVSTSPSDHLRATVTGAAAVRLVAGDDYTGPASLVLEVTDATSADDATAVTAYVSIPVQVGPLRPVLRCPSYEVDLVADGPSRTVDVPRLCHAWYPQGLDPGTLVYSARWAQQPARVELAQADSVSRGSQVVLTAQPGAPTGTGAVTVSIAGTDQQLTIPVRVTQAPPLSVRPVSVAGLVAGTSRRLDLRAYLSSPLADPQCAVTDVRSTSGAGVSATASGCVVTVSATSAASRTATLAFLISDAPGRVVPGQMTVTIQAPPDAPTGVGAVADRIAGGQARVSWSAPAYDGGLAVLEYEVRASTGKVTSCRSSPCTVTGLKNGVPVSFTVRARNGVDYSPASAASPQVTPDTKPEAVTVGVVTPGDRTLTVRWSAPRDEGSAVDRYQVQWVDVDGGSGSGTKQVAGSVLTTVIGGLTNDDRYSLRVQAHNGAGWGPYGAAVTKQSVGTPKAVPAPTVTAREATPQMDDASLTITWAAVDPNGPDLTTYTVYRDGSAIRRVSAKAQRTTSDSVPYDGRTHQYSVTATNGGGKTSPQGGRTPYRASGVPEQPGAPRASTPTADYAAAVSWQLGSSHSSRYDSLQWMTERGGSGTVSCSPTCSSGTFRQLGIQDQTVQIRARNDAGAWSPWSSPSNRYTPYGPTQPVAGLTSHVTETGRGEYTVTWTWRNVSNGRDYDSIRLSGATSKTIPGSSTSASVSGVGYSKTEKLTVTAVVDDPGAGTASASRSDSTPDKPPLRATVSPSSRSCNKAGCDPSDPSRCVNRCAYIHVSTENFRSGVNLTCDFYDSVGKPFNSKRVPSNKSVDTDAFYGYGGTVRMTCRDPGTGEAASDTYKNWPPT